MECGDQTFLYIMQVCSTRILIGLVGAVDFGRLTMERNINGVWRSNVGRAKIDLLKIGGR